MGVLVLFAVLALISAFALHDHKNRKFMIGIVGILSSIGLYGSPLLVYYFFLIDLSALLF